MPTTDWDTLQPTDGTPGNAYEYGIDVFIGAAWVNVPDITAVNPAFAPKTRNRSSYAAKGKARPNTYARDMTLSFNVEVVRNGAGSYQNELQYLLDKSVMLGKDNQVRFRVFDVEGADWAHEGVFNLEQGRPSTGDEDAGWFSFTGSSVGGTTKIPNPVNAALLPQIAAAYPSGAAAGAAVFIEGLAFTGALASGGVKFGGVNATTVTVIDDKRIRAIVPAGAAGPAAITVVTPIGTSPVALPYTRGA